MQSNGKAGSSVKMGARGPDGNVLTVNDLPKPDVIRWVPKRKAVVVCAVQGGLITLDEACERYGISIEEFISWEQAMRTYGVKGLRVRAITSRR